MNIEHGRGDRDGRGGWLARAGARLLAAALLALSAAPAGALAQAPSPAKAAVDANTAGAVACESIQKQHFSAGPDAPILISASKVVAAAGPAHEYCDITGVIAPQIGFELRLPTKTWNGRYFQTGCGGFCGAINIQSCGDAQAEDFAVAAENMGHVGDMLRDPVWGGVPELRKDFGGRSAHLMAVASKAIIASYYGAAPAFSYFRGCSTGGREGLGEAQAFPADFDGIVAGDPAFAGRLGPIANNWDARQLIDRSGALVFPPEAIALLHNAVLAACDGLDGVKDGIITDPRSCVFDPAKLACPKGKVAATCLSPEQVTSARNIYAGVRNSQGVRLFPGHLMLGSEAAWDGGYVNAFTDGAVRYIVFEKNPPAGYSHWDYDFDADVAKSEATAALYDPVAPYTRPDLAAFSARGGKLIVYHGWADQGVSPLATLDYYAKVTADGGGIDKVRDWFRVFMVPGMFHCRGGDAPNTFDMLSAAVAWVEHGKAPDQVIATESKDGKVVRTRPLAPYPQVARYTGSGDVNDAANWTVAAPAKTYDDNIDWIWAPKAR
ncbi:MAG: tannase/feruloyl esterase family alpha/beta hydrolase [Caulobacteraceae bacterium]